MGWQVQPIKANHFWLARGLGRPQRNHWKTCYGRNIWEIKRWRNRELNTWISFSALKRFYVNFELRLREFNNLRRNVRWGLQKYLQYGHFTCMHRPNGRKEQKIKTWTKMGSHGCERPSIRIRKVRFDHRQINNWRSFMWQLRIFECSHNDERMPKSIEDRRLLPCSILWSSR